MIDNMQVLALIPARGGSKRIKNKNIKLLAGKPLLAYTIEAALASNLIDRTVVSTDSQEVAAVARSHGAEVPFLRPGEIASDDSTEFEFHVHALEWLKTHTGYSPQLIVNLYPTTPFRKTETIEKAINRIVAFPDADSLRSVTKCQEHPYKMWKLDGDLLKPFVPTERGYECTLSYHLLPEVYKQNASIYITKPETLRNFGNTVGKKVVAFLMDKTESHDINFEYDFYVAEYLLSGVNYEEPGR